MSRTKLKYLDVAGLTVGLRFLNGCCFSNKYTYGSERSLKNSMVSLINVRQSSFKAPSRRTDSFKNCYAYYGYHNKKYYILLKNNTAIGWFDSGLRKFDIVVNRERSLDYYLTLLFYLFLPFLLSRYSGFMLHACGIEHKSRGLIFAGVSGTGKSTIAKLSTSRNGNIVIDDDVILVRRIKNRFIMASAPIGKEGLPQQVKKCRVNHLFFIRHERKHIIEDMGQEEKIFKIYQGQMNVYRTLFNYKDKKRGFNLLLDFVKDVACNRLGFLPKTSLLNKLSSVIK